MPTRKVKAAQDSTELHQRVAALEARLLALESRLAVMTGTPPAVLPPPEAAAGTGEDLGEFAGVETAGGLEHRIGEIGLAWLGSLVIVLGIIFLMGAVAGSGFAGFSALVGYAAAVAFLFIERFWRSSLPHLAKMLLLSGQLLLYYTTLWLHYFSDPPLIKSEPVTLALIVLALGIQFSYAIRRDLPVLAIIGLLQVAATALIADRTPVTLTFVVVAAAVGVALFIAKGWRSVLIAAVLAGYLTHLLWLMNNPLLGHPLQAVTQSQHNLIYLFAYALLFALPAASESMLGRAGTTVAVVSVLNSLGASFLALLNGLTFYARGYVGVALALAGLFLMLSMLQWGRTRHAFIPALHACFGYLALSVAVFGYARLPNAYFWLALQSLLVVSMALWFRSRLLVVVNTLIFLSILIAYLAFSPQLNLINFAFAIIALLSARIMNWKKERLTLRTESLRNSYLASAFVMVLFALHHLVPAQYVAVSWSAAAGLYFLMSVLLKNIKYRWMALGTVFATLIYLFVVDLARLEAGYRVAAFLFLGAISLTVSLYYTKFRRTFKKE